MTFLLVISLAILSPLCGYGRGWPYFIDNPPDSARPKQEISGKLKNSVQFYGKMLSTLTGVVSMTYGNPVPYCTTE
jgi:hypothetical protein